MPTSVTSTGDDGVRRRPSGVRHRAAGAHCGDVAARVSHESSPSLLVLVGLSSSPTLLLGFGLDLQSGDLSVSNKQPQHFTLPLGSGVVSYRSHKIQF